MEPKDFSYTDPDNTLSGMFREGRACYACPRLLGKYLGAANAFSALQAEYNGSGAADKLYDLCGKLACGEAGEESRAYRARALPRLEELHFLRDDKKKQGILLVELLDLFLEKESADYTQALRESRTEQLSEDLYQRFVLTPAIRAYHHGFFNRILQHLRGKEA